jgi:predicted transcriptional regulator
MNTIELKNILISEIEKIDDASFLSALKTILDSRNTAIKNYSEHYNDELKVAEEEIRNGNFYSHEEVKDKIEQWKKK